MAAASDQQSATDLFNEFLHGDSELSSDPQHVGPNFGPFQVPHEMISQQNRSNLTNEPFPLDNLNGSRLSLYTVPPYSVSQSQIHELRGYSTDPQPRQNLQMDLDAASRVLFNRSDVINADCDIQKITNDYTDMNVDHLNLFSQANDAATSLIRNFVVLRPTTFFHTEYLKALETLTSLLPRVIQEIITQVLENVLPPSDDIAMSLIRNFIEICPTTFFHVEYLRALEILTSLSPRTIQGVMSQILENGSLEVLHTRTSSKSSRASASARQSLRTTDQSFSSATTSDSQAEPIPDPIYNNQHYEQSACISMQDTRPILKRASDFLSRRTANKCHPTTDQEILCRDEHNIYQCTLKCGARFSRKPELKRHEEEGNYASQGYVCDVPPVVTIANIPTCGYCRLQNPSMEHIHAQHKDRVPYCHEKELHARGKIFMRKTRYEDHIKKVHPALPVAEYVKTSHFFVKSKVPGWCGFCEEFKSFNDSKARNNHMADHFESGLDMTTWKDAPDLADAMDEDNDTDGDEDGGENDNGAENGMDENEENTHGHQAQHKGGARANRPQNMNEFGTGGFSTFALNGLRQACSGESVVYFWKYNGVDLAGFLKRHDLLPVIVVQLGVTSSLSTGDGDKYVPLGVPSRMKLLLNDSTTGVKYYLRNKNSWVADFPLSHRLFGLTFHLKGINSTATILNGPSVPGWRNSSHTEGKSTEDSLDIDSEIQSIGGRCEKSIESTMQTVRTVRKGRSTLEVDIWTAMVPCKPHNFFLPYDELERLISFDRVYYELKFYGLEDLPSSRATIAYNIIRQCKHLFALLIYIGKGSAIINFVQNDITDKNLPLRKFDIDNLPFLSLWSPRTILDFYREQWCFIAPIFSLGQHHEFDDLMVLPFIQGDESQKSVMDKIRGGYSDVWGVRVHSAHLRISHSKLTGKAPAVAIKQLFSGNRQEFEKEVDMLKKLGSLHHSHIVELLATYRIDGRYHLIFPWAPKNLRTFWKADPNPLWTRDSILWDLTQVKGIVSGLRSIHNFKQPENSAVDRGRLLTTRGVSYGHYIYGRHGDIKPENILWFNGSDDINNGGILKIADFGTGRFHKKESRSKIDPRTIVSTLTYEPPELELALNISREYDIWSLGCVLLEYITWRLDGADMVEVFADARDEDEFGFNNDKFFSVQKDTNSGKKAYLRDGVCQWIWRLRDHRKCSQVIHDLLDLVEHQLLVIAAEDRISSFELELRLEVLWARAQTDSDYLLNSVACYSGTVSGTLLASESVAEASPPPYIISPQCEIGGPTNMCTPDRVDILPATEASDITPTATYVARVVKPGLCRPNFSTTRTSQHVLEPVTYIDMTVNKSCDRWPIYQFQNPHCPPYFNSQYEQKAQRDTAEGLRLLFTQALEQSKAVYGIVSHTLHQNITLSENICGMIQGIYRSAEFTLKYYPFALAALIYHIMVKFIVLSPHALDIETLLDVIISLTVVFGISAFSIVGGISCYGDSGIHKMGQYTY